MTTGGAPSRLRHASRLLSAVMRCAVVGSFVLLASPSAISSPFDAEEEALEVPAAENAVAVRSLAERLVARHDCWIGAAPADVFIPERAVVDTGTGPRLAASRVGFAIWQDQRPGHLYAFCR